MSTNHYKTHNHFRRLAQTMLRSSVFIFSCSSFAQVVGGQESTTIKVKTISNLIVMPAYVNNSDRLSVVLDTGSGTNVLMPSLASKLNLQSTVDDTPVGIGEDKKETMHIASGAQWAWGDNRKIKLDHQDVGWVPMDWLGQQTGHRVDGIFGTSLFQDFQIRVDYEHGEVTFASGGSPSTHGTPIPITIYEGFPFVEATLETVTGEKVRARFLIDSGTSGNLVLSRKFLDAHPSIATGHVLANTPSSTAVGGTIDLKLLRITGLDLGPFHIDAPIALVPNNSAGALGINDIAGFIGAGILSRFTVDWDYSRKTMSLTPNAHYSEPFEGDASGLRLVAEGPDWKTIRAVAVSPGEPADEAGLKAGDVLISVNNKIPPPLDELRRLFTHPGPSVNLTISRSGQQRSMTIHLRRLI